MFLAMAVLVTTAVEAMRRFLAMLFLERLWLPKARPLSTLPDLLTLTLSFVPLWVFSFGIGITPYNKC